jgi:hypothetical protein
VSAPAPSAPSAAPASTTTEGGSSSSTARTLALVAGGVGLGGVVVGAIFGLQASSKWSQAKKDCGVGCDATDDPQAFGERNDALNAATVSTIAFVAGGAAVAGGLVLWLAAPSGPSDSHAVSVTPTLGGLQAVGRF